MILRPGVPPPDTKAVFARSGWRVPTEIVPATKPKLVQIRAQAILRNRRSLTLRSVDGYPYNCVGMIFASRRAWIEIDFIYDLLRHDGYRAVRRDEVVPGDIVLYKQRGDPSHVALIMTVDQIGSTRDVRVMSKWGLDAEFLHFEADVPDSLGVPVEYYTDRNTHDHVPE